MVRYLRRVFILFFIIILPFNSNADELQGLQFIANYNSSVPPAAQKESAFNLNQTSEFKLLAMVLLAVYKSFISNQDRPACNFHPTCSEYTGQAIMKYGIIIGIIMGSDRLQRCNGHGYGYYPIHPQSGKLHDPLE